MAGLQRKCANCRYFQNAGLPGNGWCTHPKRQLNSDVKMLVRAGELACRNTWGGDLFCSQLDSDTSPSDANADMPGNDRDDEVTSVVTPPDRQRLPAEDRVVSDRPAPRHLDRNDAAILEQEERARIMARGSRDAIRHARARHSNRLHPITPDEGADREPIVSDHHPDSGERVMTHQARFSDRFLTPQQTRGGVGDHGPVPRAEIERRPTTPSDAKQFETVPDVDPNFDLPGMRRHDPPEPEMDDGDRNSHEAEPPAASDDTRPYRHMLLRTRKTRASKQRQAMRPLRHADLRLGRHPLPEVDEAGDGEAPPMAAAQEDLPARHDDVACSDIVMPHASHASEVIERITSVPLNEDQDLEGWHGPVDDHRDGNDDLPELAVSQWASDDSGGDLYDDVPSGAPAELRHRRRGWLPGLAFHRDTRTFGHDEATITRHAEFHDPWPSDEDAHGEASLEHVEPDRDTGAMEAPASWSSSWSDPAERDAPQAVVIAAPHSAEPAPGARSGHRWLPQMEPTRGPLATATRPAEVSRPLVESAPARPTPQPDAWHRHRPATHLPDLDDNLFEASFERARGSADAALPDVTPAADASHAGEAARAEERSVVDSPRDSFFRARRYPDWEERTRPAAANAPSSGTRQRLPDLNTGGLDLRELVARGGEVLDMTIDIAPEVPRQCRTCRSFRSADGGARGWCTNEWAFTHRRMVNEDDLACDSTIGCWWLPSDRYLIAEDVNGYASPTPRMDVLIAWLNAVPAQKMPGA